MADILSIHDLEVQRNGRTVLHIPNLTVPEGKVLAVIGPNGAGKSTLLLAIARLLQPAQGQVLFRSQPILPTQELTYRRQLALVLQEPLLLNMSVYDNVATALRFRRLPRAEVRQRVKLWLQRLGVAHLSSRSARSISGGEAQRASLARAFAIQPALLLLDEPFSALDAPTRQTLLHDLHTLLNETGITTIFITHDLDEALLLGDQVAVLLDGRLRQVGPPQQVFTAPNDAEVAAFVGVETVIAGRVSESNEGQLIIQANGLRLEAVGEAAVGQTVLYCLRPEDITLLPASTSPPASSARNHLPGVISRLTPNGPLVRVVVASDSLSLVALVTRASAQELSLAPGMPVLATFKATAAHIITK